MEAWVAFISGVLGPVLLLIVKNLLDTNKKRKKDPLKEATEFSSDFEHILEDLRDDVDADRVWVSQFHNGGHFYPTGKSIQKYSIFYETTHPEKMVKPVKMDFQNIPVSLFSHSINEVFTKGYMIATDLCSEDKYGLKFIAQQYGTKSIYYFALKNLEGRFVGTLGIEYTEEVTKLDHDQVDLLLIKSVQLGAILDKHLKS